MILINRLCVPDVPLEIYSFLKFVFIVFKFLSLQWVKLLMRQKLSVRPGMIRFPGAYY